MREVRRVRLGVRSRATLVAVVVAAAVLAAGTSVLLDRAGDRIASSQQDAAVARAESLRALLAAGALEDPLPGRDPELFAQVVDASGEVVASDRAIAGIPAVWRVAVGAGEERVAVLDDILEGYEDEAAGLEDQGPYAVVALGVTLPSGPGTVLVAASLEDAAQARNAILPLLGVGLPLLLTLVAVAVWFLTGRALRPVAEMSREAGRISALALDRRLPVPGARDEIYDLALTLNEMLDRLEAASTRRRRFVADASHELKSPLAAMRTVVDVAGADGTLDEQSLGDLRRELERMTVLVGDLLSLAAHDESPRRAGGEDIAFDLLVNEAVRAVGRAPGVTVAVSDATGALPVRGDPERVAALVRNLVDNAVRHAASRVWVETAREADWAVVRVSDDGPGVPAGEGERIFERFVRLDESRSRAAGGTGLGLAVARAVAREHGGEVVLAAPRHGGATFEARLPIAES
jgi:signal transduction histidine kinase